MLVKVNSKFPSKRQLSLAKQSLKSGGLIVYPTDTLYGIGCDMYCNRAVKNIYNIKKMNQKKPLSFIFYDFKHISEYAIISNFAFKMMKYILPGPFTIILKAQRKVPNNLLTKQKTLGVRIPDNNFIRQVVSAFGSPIISTTITFDEGIFSNPSEIHALYQSRLDVVFDDGISYSDPSTIIYLTTDSLRILREGARKID